MGCLRQMLVVRVSASLQTWPFVIGTGLDGDSEPDLICFQVPHWINPGEAGDLEWEEVPA